MRDRSKIRGLTHKHEKNAGEGFLLLVRLKGAVRSSLFGPPGNISYALLLTALLLCFALCDQAAAKLNVVATTPDFASIASAIGGDEISLTTLAKPTEDPHFVDAKPSFIVKLNRA